MVWRAPLWVLPVWLLHPPRPGSLAMMWVFAIAACVSLVLGVGFAWTLLLAASSRDRRPRVGQGGLTRTR